MEIFNYKENPKIKRDIQPLFIRAFPREERPPVNRFFGCAKNEGNDIYAYYENNEFIGFTQLTIYKDTCYLFFLAVNDNKRNQGYGSKILKLVKEYQKDRVVLLCYEEVDDKYKDNELRKKRKDFYYKNGFKDNGMKTNEFGVVYETCYYGSHTVPFEDYIEIFIQGFGEFARKYIKKEN